MSSATGNSPYQFLRYPDSVRLLHVFRKDDGSIAGHLKEFRLDSPRCPRFRTLSYAWGAPSRQRSIDLDGTAIPVLDTVYPILEALCDNLNLQSHRWFWIDSICINQVDIEEREAQVELMGLLFSRSEATIVWLGPGTEESDEAMDFFATLAARRDELAKEWEVRGVRRLPPDLNDQRKWKLLGDLLQLPWWRRVWTMQEFLLARRLMFYCGRKTMSLRLFHRALYSLHCCRPGELLIKNDAWVAAWNRRRLRQWRAKPGCSDRMGLIALVAYASDCFVTDPKDRIYSFLGITTDSDRLLVGHPTYGPEVSVGMVYTNLVKSFVRTYRSLDIVCFSTFFNAANREEVLQDSEPALASWVPDWRVRSLAFVVPLMVSQSGRSHIGNFYPVAGREDPVATAIYAASGDTTPEYSFSEDASQLTCKGIIVDSIDGLGTTSVTSTEENISGGSERFVQSTSKTNSTVSENSKTAAIGDLGGARELFDSVIRSMVLDRWDRYLSTSAPLDQYRDEFLNLATVAHNDIRSDVYRWFISWIQDNKNILMRGYTFEDIYSSVCPISSPQSIDLSIAPEKGVAYRTYDTTSPQRMKKRLMVTDKGHVGMAPFRARKGDLVCVLYGCSIPVVLRAHGEAFEFIGECYLDGFMNGEILNTGPESRDLVLV